MASTIHLCTLIMLISSTLADNCCIIGICVYATTSADGIETGTMDPYCIEFQAKGKTYKATLDNIPDPGKSELWELDLHEDFGIPNNTCLKKDDITKPAISNSKKDGTDGWRIHSITTIAKKAEQESLSVDMGKHQWVDNDGDPTVQPGVVKKFELNLANVTSCD